MNTDERNLIYANKFNPRTDKATQYRHDYYLGHKTELSLKAKDYRKTEAYKGQREKRKLKDLIWRGNVKFSVLAVYSEGQPKCSCCSEQHIEFLTIDHVNGKGNEHRRKLFGYNTGGSNFYNWLIRNGFPKGYKVLCCNCNFSKGHYGYCPHGED